MDSIDSFSWKIKAKVIFKSPISDTVRGDKFFVDLLDQSGQIRGTAFGFDCIRLYHQFHVTNRDVTW